MKFAQHLVLLSAATVLSGCIVIATPSSANYHAQKSLTLDASSINKLNIDAGAGSLDVIGDENITQIELVADIYTDKKYRENYLLDLYQRDGKAYIIAKNKSTAGMWVGDSPRINITIKAPKHLLLDIEDDSGNTTVSNFSGDVVIEDDSGDLVVKNISGNLKINDDSGDLLVSDIGGNVEINDDSGDMTVTNIGGRLDIEDDSGDLTVKKVKGLVIVDDGSGSIDINQVGGLKIIDAGSGGLNVKGVEGNFEIDS